MPKHLLFLLLLVHMATCIKAQENTNTSFLLIPYQPEFYLSDAERDLIQQSDIAPDEYRRYFRRTLDLKLMAELETLGPVYSLLQDTSISSRKELQRYYGSTGFAYAQPVGPRKANNQEEKKSGRKAELLHNQHAAPQTITTRGDTKYMQSTPGDTTFFASMALKYQAEYVISINQFEIKTNYNTCIDIANKIYRRELIIHYSIMDVTGKELIGNFAYSFFPSNSNRYSEIAERCFPEIAKEITGNLLLILKK